MIDVAGMIVQIDASPRVCTAMATRFGAFAGDRPPAIVLEVRERAPFRPELEVESEATLVLDGPDRVRLEAPGGSGWFDLAAGRGFVEAGGLGAVDALLRAALSLTLPLNGTLLLHGALLPDGRAFLGASGAGKSTVARAAGAACDEMVAARPGPAVVRLHATPWWHGRPLSVDAGALVCLGRDAAPSVRRLGAVPGVRTLLHHVVRYVSQPVVDELTFALAAAVCARTPVVEAICPTGAAFLPFLFGELARLEASA